MNGKFAKLQLQKYGGDLERLNIHTHHGCNLRCSGCSHHSEFVAPNESIDIDSTLKDLETLMEKVKVQQYHVLGGEPLLNPEGTKRVCEFLLDKGEKPKLVTNGLLLDKNMGWIIDFVKRGMILKISLHLAKTDKGGEVQRKKVLDFCKFSKEQGIKLKTGTNHIRSEEGWVEVSPEFKNKSHWYHFFRRAGDKIYPYTSDQSKAFKICEQNCAQLYKGNLFKCPHAAYLHDTLTITDQLNDPTWKEHLQYTGYSVEENLDEFLKVVYNPESICSSCPENPEYITVNQDFSIEKRKLS